MLALEGVVVVVEVAVHSDVTCLHSSICVCGIIIIYQPLCELCEPRKTLDGTYALAVRVHGIGFAHT